MTTGFQQINQQLWINKDPEAQLFYTFDWSEWLVSGDTIASAVYTAYFCCCRLLLHYMSSRPLQHKQHILFVTTAGSYCCCSRSLLRQQYVGPYCINIALYLHQLALFAQAADSYCITTLRASSAGPCCISTRPFFASTLLLLQQCSNIHGG